MFAEKTMEASAITGTGSYQLGTSVGAFKTWRSQFATLSPVFYCAENADGTIWEIGYGTLTYGSPDTISRSVLASSTGSAISWAVADAPVYVFSAPLATWMKHMALGGRATVRPAWLPRGGGWLDESDPGAWSTTRAIDYLYNGTGDVERGRHESAASIYVPSARNLWVDKGAANYTITSHDVGKVLVFDTTAAARTLSLIAGASFGHGATLWFLGYGGTTNGVVLTPSGSEAIDAGANGASLTVVPNRLTRVSWDAAKSKWRTDYTDYRAAITFGAGGRNRLINGSMRTDQRNAGAAQTFTAAAAVAYCVDRWYGSCTGANVNGQRVAGAGAYQYLYQFTGAASVTQVLLGQRIEATNICDLVGTTATLSAMISSSTLTSITWTAYYPTVADTFTTKTQIATGTFTINSTLTRYSAQIALGANVDKGLAIEFTTGAFTSGTLKIGGVQLEPGSAVTDFEVIAVDDEMFRCQRYYETGLGTIAIAYIPSPGWNMANAFGFKVTKRTTPTITTTFGTLHTTNLNGVVLYATMNSAPEQDNLTFTAAAEL